MTVRNVAKRFLSKTLVIFAATLLSLLTSRADAAPLPLSPGDEICTTNDNSNLTTSAQVVAVLRGCGLTPPEPLELLYKADQGGNTHQGTFGSSYNTLFDNTPTDPEDATILYVSGPFIDCTVCYLVVKDGKSTPAQYLFDISASWDGVSNIELTNFWIGKGAISNVAIWGEATAVPEPATVVLLSTGLGLLLGRRRRHVA
jgi:hypothetical protein